jgi:hypothetical protein
LDIAGLDEEAPAPPPEEPEEQEQKEAPVEPVQPVAELAQEIPDIRDFELSIPEEEMSQITREMLLKLRRCVSAFASAQRLRYEEQLRARTAQVEVAATKELHRKAEEIRLIYQSKFEAKELSLRRHYQRLVRLANKITRQKAELQQARKELEGQSVPRSTRHPPNAGQTHRQSGRPGGRRRQQVSVIGTGVALLSYWGCLTFGQTSPIRQ